MARNGEVDDQAVAFVLHTKHVAVAVRHGGQILRGDVSQIDIGGFAARAGREQHRQDSQHHRDGHVPEKSSFLVHSVTF